MSDRVYRQQVGDGCTVTAADCTCDRMMSGRDPKNISRHVGARIKFRRTFLGLSLADVGDRVGISFQQVHKYETGENRVGAGRLYDFSQALGVPVEYFFERLPPPGKSASKAMAERDMNAFLQLMLSKRDVIDLNLAFMQIEDTALRRPLIELIYALGRKPLDGNA